MGTADKTTISVQTLINSLSDMVWKCWTTPEDIIHWNQASEDWHSPRAQNDLRPGGRFTYRMEAKDGSMGFDFSGVYKKVIKNKQIDYVLDDGRKVTVTFSARGNKTEISERFEAEDTHSAEMQRSGWQAILDNFKNYTETQSK